MAPIYRNPDDRGRKWLGVVIDWLHIVLSPVWECFTPIVTSALPVKGCKKKVYAWRLHACTLWAGRDLYRAIPALTRDLCLHGLIQRTALINRFLRHTRDTGDPLLTQDSGGPGSCKVTVEEDFILSQINTRIIVKNTIQKKQDLYLQLWHTPPIIVSTVVIHLYFTIP